MKTLYPPLARRAAVSHLHHQVCCSIIALCLLLAPADVDGGWPAGTYAIPMSKTGCPEVTDFTWEVGTRTHQTEMGSHASDPSHLAGIYTYETDRVTQSFCVKTTDASDGLHTWQKGRYCIMKVKSCPKGFREGWLYWDDAAPWFADTVQNQSGTLPDGVYDRNTKIMFCCRNDGSAAEHVELPTNSPFHLLRWGDRCQEVKGMSVVEEYVYWEDERAMNMNTQGGLFPSVLRSKYPKKYTKVYYCYYTKAPPNRNLKTLFTILYVIAGVAGAIIFLLILLCVIQRIANRKNKQFYDDHQVSNAARERMIQQRERDIDRHNHHAQQHHHHQQQAQQQHPQVVVPAAPSPHQYHPSQYPPGAGVGVSPHHHQVQQHQPATHRPLLPTEPLVEYRPPEYMPAAGGAADGGAQGDGSVSFSSARDPYNNSKTPMYYPNVEAMPSHHHMTPQPMAPPPSGGSVAVSNGGPPPPAPQHVPLQQHHAVHSAVPLLESPTNDGPASISSAEEHTPMLQPPPFDPARSMSPQPGMVLDMRRPISQPPSYEEVLREDGKLPPS